MITENLSTLKIHKLTQAQYDRELAAGRIDQNALYLTPDEEMDLSQYATKEEVLSTCETKSDASDKLTEAKDYAKEYADTVADGKADAIHNHAISDITSLETSLNAKVPKTRTVNGKALSANITLTAADISVTDTSANVQTQLNTLFDALDNKFIMPKNENFDSFFESYAEDNQNMAVCLLPDGTIMPALYVPRASYAQMDDNGNTITATYETKEDASAKLAAAETYAISQAQFYADNALDMAKSYAADQYGIAKDYTDNHAVPNTRTINGHELTSDITLTATDIGGFNTTASGDNAHAMGCYSTASGANSFASGFYSTAAGSSSFAQGVYANAAGDFSSAHGYYTIANDYQGVFGKYNTEKNPPATADTQDTSNADAVFMVGCGTSAARKNGFRVTSNGKCYGASAFGASGADFAELFEWEDGNPNNEDRRGLFVTLEGEKIRLANADDDYIGVISGSQAFIGNSASEEWQGKYLTDVFGMKITQEIKIPAKIDKETGEVITPATTTTQYVLNPNYDPNEPYVMRENRKEWGIVGLLGQIVMIDDGTCVAGGYVKPSVNGVGTAANSGYRVMKRINENHIKVLVK